MDGTITIGTEIDTKGFEKDLEKLKDGEQLEMEAMLKAKGIEIPEDEAKAIADELSSNLKLDLDTKSFDVSIAKVKSELLVLKTLWQNKEKLGLTGDEIFSLIEAIEQAKNKLKNLQDEKKKTDEKGFKETIKDLKKIIKNVGAWALAIFGIRSAFNAVRNAMSIITQNDKELANDIQFVKTALAYTLEPIIRGIVNLMKTLAQYVAYVVKAWTGRDIFASAKKNLQAGEKSAKSINKSMAGFDEMNTLQSSSDGGSGGGGYSGIEPLPEGDAPKWLQWIAKNKDIIIAGLLGIAGALLVVKLGLTSLLGGVIVGLIIALVTLIIQNWDTVKEVLGKVWAWIDEHIIQPIVKGFTWLWEKIKEIFGPVISWFASIFSTVWTNIQTVWNNVVAIFTWVWGKIKDIFGPIVSWFKEKFETARDKIKSVFEPIVNFFSDIWNKVKTKLKEFGEKVGDVVGGAFKSVINGVLKVAENVLNAPIKAINKLIGKINDIPGISLGKLSTFSLPRLAKGGIVNMPGSGVPVGGAMTGESGREGVIPLTDSQQMALLGEAIGRYITINANITNTMNGRVISRELQKIQNESNFANNM